ncbi:hypothetical protein AAEY27_17240 [Kosakonia sp. BYX6]|uniref:Tlde1 domain-containing protein n=1 Tax=Kosakonia calanthes TaxID=3139408 RepID=A0ABZ3BBD4_9ENTR
MLSGIDKYINNPNCSDIEKAAIPPGTYWIREYRQSASSRSHRSHALV